MARSKKLHWTQRPGAAKKVRAAALKGHRTKKASRKTWLKETTKTVDKKISRAEEVIKATVPPRPLKIDVLIRDRIELHDRIKAYLDATHKTAEVTDVYLTKVLNHGAELLAYIDIEVMRLNFKREAMLNEGN